MPQNKKRLLVDFDGVLHRYTGWKGGILGEPIAGARHAMHLLSREFELVCFTTRADRPDMKGWVEEWLRRYGFPHMRVTCVKEPAHLTLDDRALHFGGVWTDALLTQIRNFRPYWETPPSTDSALESPLPPQLATGLSPEDELQSSTAPSPEIGRR